MNKHKGMTTVREADEGSQVKKRTAAQSAIALLIAAGCGGVLAIILFVFR